MLIIAMPKSASSSLARTIARAHGLDERNDDINAGHPPQHPDRHPAVLALHPFPAVPTPELRTIVRDRTALRKLHLHPTDEVLAAIEGEPVVILLRDPDEVIDAEFRAAVTGIHRWPAIMPRTASIGRWRAAADRVGLRASLLELEASWRAVAAARPDILLVTHAELILDPVTVLRRCSAHLGLPERSTPGLLRERYSGPSAPIPRRSAAGTLMRSLGFVAGSLLRRAVRAAHRRIAARTGPSRNSTGGAVRSTP